MYLRLLHITRGATRREGHGMDAKAFDQLGLSIIRQLHVNAWAILSTGTC